MQYLANGFRFLLRHLLFLIGLCAVMCLFPLPGMAVEVAPGTPIVLRLNPVNAFTRVAPPAQYQPVRSQVQGATFQVNYTGFSPQAQTAMQYAVDIWASLLNSSVPITVQANWSPLGSNILGQCGPTNVLRDFSGATQANTWYAVALANKLAGQDLVPGTVDMTMTLSSDSPWYYGLDGNPPAGQIDLVSVILHELGHGLGFLGSMSVSGGQGSWGMSNYPMIYDRYTVNGNNISLLNTGSFPNPSTALAAQLQSGNVFFTGTSAVAANGGTRVKLYAPSVWEQGSSYSHFDESTYPAGNPNSLMTPVINYSEANHNPGPVALGVMKDSGWTMSETTPQRQPDLWIRNASDTESIGMNVYNLDGTNQTKQQTVAAGVTAVYRITLENDGTAADAFTLTGTAGSTHWVIRYYDAATGGNDITTQVTGIGYSSATLAAAGTLAMRVEVTPDSSVANSEQNTVLLTATSNADGSKKDAVKALTTKLTSTVYRPDAQVKNAVESAYAGDNVYNTDGTNQTRVQTVAASVAATYHVKIENDGNAADAMKVTGPAGSGGWSVQYFDAISGGNDITAAVTGAGYTTASLQPAGSMFMRVVVTPAPSLADGALMNVSITAASAGNTAWLDTVKTITTKQGGTQYQPDLWVKNATDTDYIGDNTYNSDAAGQVKAQTAFNTEPLVYEVVLENDGNVQDTFTLTGPRDSGGWKVRYYDVLSGADITSDITGIGYSTVALAAGAQMNYRIEVAADETVAENAVFTVVLSVVSAANATKRDAVKVVTTRQTPPAYQPDLLIKNSTDVDYTGANVYSLDGADQIKQQATSEGIAAVYHLMLENDGERVDAFRITGQAGSNGWTVRYFDDLTGGLDITDLILQNRYTTPTVGAGGAFVFRVEVTPGSAVPTGGQSTITITATSANNTDRIDAVRALTAKAATPGQPDLRLRISTDTAYIGDNIYNTTGAGQTKSTYLAPGGAVVYLFHAQNDGPATDNIEVTGTAGGAGWTVRYYDAGGADITAQITGNGWFTGVLATGEYKLCWARVTAGATLGDGATAALALTAVSTTSAVKTDVVKTTTTVKRYQPDLWLRMATEANYSGDNLFSTDGGNQAKTRAISAGVQSAFLFRVQNDGVTADTFKVTGTAGGSGWTVRYYNTATNADITAAVTGSGWTTGPLAPGASTGCWASVTATAGMTAGSMKTLLVTAVSLHNTLRKDVVRATTTVTVRCQPDGWIRAAGETAYKGDNIYNLDGANQTRGLTVAAGVAAVYPIRVQNDGEQSDTFIITGIAGGSGWTVRYYDMATNTNITAEVTGKGYTTGQVAAGGAVALWAQVIPSATVAANATQTLLITATSATDLTKQDVVKAVTTKQ